MKLIRLQVYVGCDIYNSQIYLKSHAFSPEDHFEIINTKRLDVCVLKLQFKIQVWRKAENLGLIGGIDSSHGYKIRVRFSIHNTIY